MQNDSLNTTFGVETNLLEEIAQKSKERNKNGLFDLSNGLAGFVVSRNARHSYVGEDVMNLHR